MTDLSLSHVGKTYADGTEALRDIQIHADSGEIVREVGHERRGTRADAHRIELPAGADAVRQQQRITHGATPPRV